MANLHRGEIEGVLDGKPYRLCLTLGALADLEAAFGDDNMLELAQRFESGRLSARDCIRIVGAGVRGAGHEITDEIVARMQADGGLKGFIDIVARLLTATFGAHSSPKVSPSSLPSSLPSPLPSTLPTPSGEVQAPVPFPGTT